jgi:hypothetical protein
MLPLSQFLTVVVDGLPPPQNPHPHPLPILPPHLLLKLHPLLKLRLPLLPLRLWCQTQFAHLLPP